jgi:hydroxymethylbilane synthase
MNMIVRIGTRGSKLAIAQSKWVKGVLEAKDPSIKVELVAIKTTGDKVLDSPLSLIGGKGLFVKEIEQALMEDEVDIAVHSMKDVPADLPEGLVLSSFPKREDYRDAFISSQVRKLEDIPSGARIGTSSLRRSTQLLNFRSDLDIVPLRGNVDTRLGKLDSGDLHAIILAAAGLRRLGLSDRITQFIPASLILPAVGQGALGLEVRRDDKETINMLSFMNHKPTEVAVKAERAFLKELGGGCQVPIAAIADIKGEDLFLRGMVGTLDGSKIVADATEGTIKNPEEIGLRLARQLLESGAEKILSDIYG